MRPTLSRRRVGLRPEFTIAHILAWADSHRRRTGRWPHINAGPVLDGPLGETWRKIDSALRLGLRGLPGGSSLPRLLAERRQARNLSHLPPLRPEQILAWADAHQRRRREWPTSEAGPIAEAPGETWRSVDQALRGGLRGLPGGSSLARLLADQRGVRNLHAQPPLTVRQILAWADAHHLRTGEWPTGTGGAIEKTGETWKGVQNALYLGRRGLPGGSSLARLLAEHRGVRNPRQRPPLTVRQILGWARAHRRRTGAWPLLSSGPVAEAPEETWSAIHAALVSGYRGLPAGLTLAGLLAAGRAIPTASSRSPLSLAQILAWADAHHQRTGSWPHSRTGPVADAPGETWRSIDQALRANQRGLTCGQTLVQLLVKRRGVRNRHYAPPLTEAQILTWARAHFRRTGAWPNQRSGPVAEAPDENWREVDNALRQGCRGLSGRQSLAGLLADRLGLRNRTSLPHLQLNRIVEWAREHHRRTGCWPSSRSGPITGAEGETWKGVDLALRWGYRGLRGGMTLARFLARRLGVRNRSNLPPLCPDQILTWAERHFRRTGAWPTRDSGPIADARGESWNAVDLALSGGYRGLPGHSSLAQLLDEHQRTAARR